MTTLLLVWLVLASLSEHLLALTPATIPVVWKRLLYYLLVGPEIALGSIKNLLGRLAGFQILAVASWFRS